MGHKRDQDINIRLGWSRKDHHIVQVKVASVLLIFYYLLVDYRLVK